MKLRNKTDNEVILCGYHAHTSLTIQPGEIVDLDPERLKMFDPRDLERQLEPAGDRKPEAPPEPPKAPAPDPDKVEQDRLLAMLRDVNAPKS